MDTKEKERVRRPQSGKPKAKPPAQGKGRAKQSAARTAVRSNVKEQPKRQRRKPSATTKKRSIAEDVVYLPPKPFSRKRLLLRLATVVAVVFAVVFSISIFFKVDKEKISVSGNEKYTVNAIKEASGIQDGDKLLTFNRAKTAGKIISKLPFVESVRFGIKLPDTVYIEITEIEVGYAAEDTTGAWWLISAGGKVLQKLSVGENSGYTNLLGFKLDKPEIGEQAAVQEEAQPETDEAGNTIPLVMTTEKKFHTALNILQYLEQNVIIGEAAFLDVTDLGNISVQYGSRYLVQLGDDTQLSYKISLLKAAVAKVQEDYPYSSGTLDLSDPGNIRFDRDET